MVEHVEAVITMDNVITMLSITILGHNWAWLQNHS